MCHCPKCQADSFNNGVCSKCGLKISHKNWEATGAVLGLIYRNARYYALEVVKGNIGHDQACAKKFGANLPYIFAGNREMSRVSIVTAVEWLNKNGYLISVAGKFWPSGYTKKLRME